MRLLHFDKSGRLTWSVFSSDIPPYAILSHTWDIDEFNFEDLVNRTGESKAGYRKILFRGEQAARDHLQYFWVDTCCIDKWNLGELSIAINSMFRWYRNAAKCYVFPYFASILLATLFENSPYLKSMVPVQDNLKRTLRVGMMHDDRRRDMLHPGTLHYLLQLCRVALEPVMLATERLQDKGQEVA
jgi:hypothetical protein